MKILIWLHRERWIRLGNVGSRLALATWTGHFSNRQRQEHIIMVSIYRVFLTIPVLTVPAPQLFSEVGIITSV